MRTRADASEETFDEAADLARSHGMMLSNPSAGCYQLRHSGKGWIINFYPRRHGFSARVYHDPRHPGPFLKLAVNWTLLDAVKAAIEKEGSET